MSNEKYELLDKLYKENEGISWNMAILWLMENGYNDMAEMTDEDIQKAECPQMFADDFFRDILKLTRQLAKETSPYDLLMYAMVNPFRNLMNFHNVPTRTRLEEMIKNAIYTEIYSKPTVKDVENFCEKYCCSAEELEMLGIEIPDKYWEEYDYR